MKDTSESEYEEVDDENNLSVKPQKPPLALASRRMSKIERFMRKKAKTIPDGVLK